MLKILTILTLLLTNFSVFADSPQQPKLDCPVNKQPENFTQSNHTSKKEYIKANNKISKIQPNVYVYCGDMTNTQTNGETNTRAEKKCDSPSESIINKIKSILEGISKILSAIAWPFVAIYISRKFKSELTSLLRRLKKGKIGGFDVEFEALIKDAKELDPEQGIENESIDVDTASKASSNPRESILTSWIEVEHALKKAVDRNSQVANIVTNKRAKGTISTISAIQQTEKLDNSYIAILHDLRVMRNEAAHAVDFNPSSDSVISYILLARKLVAELSKI